MWFSGFRVALSARFEPAALSAFLGASIVILAFAGLPPVSPALAQPALTRSSGAPPANAAAPAPPVTHPKTPDHRPSVIPGTAGSDKSFGPLTPGVVVRFRDLAGLRR